MFDITLLLSLGLTAGFLAGLLGIGGGAILVPGLFYAFTLAGYPTDTLMHMAIGTSLAIIVPTGLSSTYAHHKKSAVDFNVLKQMGPGILCGSLAGSIIAGLLSGPTLKIIFAIAITLLALKMLLTPKATSVKKHLPPFPWPGIASLFTGGISALIGIGGATLNVPYMSFYGVKIHRAIGTAAALGLFISIPGALGFIFTGWDEAARPPYSLGYVNLTALVCIAAASVLAAPVGAWAAHKVPVSLMKQGFAIFMVIVAVKMLIDVL